MSNYKVSDSLLFSDNSTPGAVTLPGSVSGSLTITVPTDVTSYTLTLPSTAGAASDVLTSTDSAGSTTWSPPPAFPTYNIWTFSEVLSSGTSAGSSPASTWTTRQLNTTTKPTGTGTEASLVANGIVLSPGIWKLEGYAPAYGTPTSNARLYNSTTATVLAVGMPSQAGVYTKVNSVTVLITVTSGTETILLQQNISAAYTNNLGIATGFGEPETYAVVNVTLVG